MNAPLSRDQQIDLMKNARERHEARIQALLTHRVIREVISRPAEGQESTSYLQEDRRIACC